MEWGGLWTAASCPFVRFVGESLPSMRWKNSEVKQRRHCTAYTTAVGSLSTYLFGSKQVERVPSAKAVTGEKRVAGVIQSGATAAAE